MAEDPRTEYQEARYQLALKGPIPGTYWRHVRRGTYYRVLSCAIWEANYEPSVVYQTVIHHSSEVVVWVRPLHEFTDGRFIAVGPEEVGNG